MARNAVAIMRSGLASVVMLAGLVGCLPEIDGVGPVVQFEGKNSFWPSGASKIGYPLSYFEYSDGNKEFVFDKETSRAVYNYDDYLNKNIIFVGKRNLVLEYNNKDQLIEGLRIEGISCKDKCSRRSCTWLASTLSGKDIRMSPKVCATITYMPDSCFPKMKDDCVSVTDFTREY